MSEAEQRRIVGVVEDSDEDFAVFDRAFRGSWDVRRWRSGEEALREFRDDEPRLEALSVLVVDLHLGGLTGVETVEQVRALPAGRELTVCLLTGSRREEDRRRGLDAGADAYLVKPDDAARLRELPAMLARLADER